MLTWLVPSTSSYWQRDLSERHETQRYGPLSCLWVYCPTCECTVLPVSVLSCLWVYCPVCELTVLSVSLLSCLWVCCICAKCCYVAIVSTWFCTKSTCGLHVINLHVDLVYQDVLSLLCAIFTYLLRVASVVLHIHSWTAWDNQGYSQGQYKGGGGGC